jgi:2-C-methyl-D-erythritol 4-phosphate cytidylyltransferase
MNVVALVPVAGRGDVVAQVLTRVAGVPLLVHALRALLESDRVTSVVVVRDGSEVDGALAEFGLRDSVAVMPGALSDVWTSVSAGRPDVVLVHDPLRAFTPTDLVDRVVTAVLDLAGPVVPVLPCSDTVKRVDDHDSVLDTPDRAGLRVTQTPLGYPAAMVTSATLGSVPVGASTVLGDPLARRLAGPVDLAMMGGGLA